MIRDNYLFESDRLGFRFWKEEDFPLFALLGKDIEGMQFFSRPYTDEESYIKIYEHIMFLEDNGYGFWAVELKETREFIGTIGFNYPSIDAFFTPCVQIGWCLSRKFWNQGLATEGASAAISYIKENTSIEEIYSYTTIENIPSARIMQKIGMQYIQDFTLNDDPQKYVAYHLKLI